MNRTLPINNKYTQMSCFIFFILYSLLFLLYYLLFSLLFTLFHNITRYQHDAPTNQLRTSGSFFSITTVLCVSQFKVFLILSQIIILPLYSSSCDKNYLTLSIFIFVLLFLFLFWRWLLLLLLLLLLLI